MGDQLAHTSGASSRKLLWIDPLASSSSVTPLLSQALVVETFLWTLQGPGSVSLVPGSPLSSEVGDFSSGPLGQVSWLRRELPSVCLLGKMRLSKLKAGSAARDRGPVCLLDHPREGGGVKNSKLLSTFQNYKCRIRGI